MSGDAKEMMLLFIMVAMTLQFAGLHKVILDLKKQIEDLKK